MIETRALDIAECLTNQQTIVYFLTDAFHGGDPKDIAESIAIVIRARGGAEKLSQETGIAMDDLNAVLSDEPGPNLSTLVKLLQSLGVELTAPDKRREPVAA